MPDGTIRWWRVDRPDPDLYLSILPRMREIWTTDVSPPNIEIERTIVRLRLVGHAFDCADYRPDGARYFGRVEPGHVYKMQTSAPIRGWAKLRVDLSVRPELFVCRWCDEGVALDTRPGPRRLEAHDVLREPIRWCRCGAHHGGRCCGSGRRLEHRP